MGRSGYGDGEPEDNEDWLRYMGYRQAVTNALRGKRGLAFLREMRDALDAMPLRRLVPQVITDTVGEVCALGAVGRKRGLDLSKMDPEAHDALAKSFGIATCMAREIEYVNDDDVHGPRNETPEARWTRVRAWVQEEIAAAEGSPHVA